MHAPDVALPLQVVPGLHRVSEFIPCHWNLSYCQLQVDQGLWTTEELRSKAKHQGTCFLVSLPNPALRLPTSCMQTSPGVTGTHARLFAASRLHICIANMGPAELLSDRKSHHARLLGIPSGWLAML